MAVLWWWQPSEAAEILSSAGITTEIMTQDLDILSSKTIRHSNTFEGTSGTDVTVDNSGTGGTKFSRIVTD